MKGLTVFVSVAMVLIFGIVLPAHATLVDMNDGTIYDTDTQLSWLRDANIGLSLLHINPSGETSWDSASTIVATLNDGGGFAGLTGWRLPSTTQPDASCDDQYDLGGGSPLYGYGYHCTGSELGHLYYVALGNPVGGPVTNPGPFVNILTDVYWSRTEANLSSAWGFNFDTGYQDIYGESIDYGIWPVRPGARALPGSPVGYNPAWLAITLMSLIVAGGALLRRKIARQ